MPRIMWFAGGFAVLWIVVVINFAMLTMFGLLEPEKETLIVDAKQVVRIFVEERGEKLNDGQLTRAITLFDKLVNEEAQAIFAETGQPIINGKHMLAGGRDVSREFALRVIRKWDQSQ